MPHIADEILGEINELIDADRLVLPTLPEIALRARETAEDPDATANDLAQVINNDAAITARIIKVANSPLMRGNRDVQDVKMAIARLGIPCISNLVTGLAMEQMFQATSELIDRTMRESWKHSTDVAGVAQVISSHYTRLRPDQATLAGLVHAIGVLPILSYAEEFDRLNDPITLRNVIDRIHPTIGTRLLESWDFPAELVAVPENYRDFYRETESGKADYADIVMVANLQTFIDREDHPYAQLDWDAISAFKRVGFRPLPTTDDAEEEDLSQEMLAAMDTLQAG